VIDHAGPALHVTADRDRSCRSGERSRQSRDRSLSADAGDKSVDAKAVSADGEDVSRQESASVGLLYEIFSARELKAAFPTIAPNNLLHRDVLVAVDLAPNGSRDRFA
jgi:hypothetical protein